MNNIFFALLLKKIAVFIVVEVFANFTFFCLNVDQNAPCSTLKSQEYLSQVRRGILERAVIFLGLLNGYPQIIIAFSALKLGSRIKITTEESYISNQYFLSGNLLSLGFVIAAAAISAYVCSL